jgi:tetratricopeptide (TPR) repeat protein
MDTTFFYHTRIMRYTSYPHVMATMLLCSMSLQGCQSALNALQEEPLSQERQVPGVCPQGDSTTLSIPLLHIVFPLAPHRTDDRTVTPVHPRVVVTPFVSGALGMLPTVSSAQRLTDGHHVSGATPIPDSLTKASYGPFTASNGDLVRFQRVGRQWQAVDLFASSAYASQRILPVVSAEALNSFLTWLKDQDRWTSRARIHVLHTSQPSFRSCVYVGKYGLLGGMRQEEDEGEDEGEDEDEKSPANPTNVQDLVERYNRETDPEARSQYLKTLEECNRWFREQDFSDLVLHRGEMLEYAAALAHIETNQENRSVLRSYCNNLFSRIETHHENGEEALLDALEYTVSVIDSEVFEGTTSLTNLASKLLDKLDLEKNAFIRKNHAYHHSILSSLHQIFVRILEVSGNSSYAETELYQSFKAKVTALKNNADHYPIGYHAQLIEQSLSRLEAHTPGLTRSDARHLLWAGIHSGKFGFNALTIIPDMDLLESGYRHFKELVERPGVEKKDWYDLHQLMYFSVCMSLENPEHFEQFKENLSTLEIKKSDHVKEHFALHFGIGKQLRWLASHGPTPKVRKGSINLLAEKAQQLRQQISGRSDKLHKVLEVWREDLAIIAAQNTEEKNRKVAQDALKGLLKDKKKVAALISAAEKKKRPSAIFVSNSLLKKIHTRLHNADANPTSEEHLNAVTGQSDEMEEIAEGVKAPQFQAHDSRKLESPPPCFQDYTAQVKVVNYVERTEATDQMRGLLEKEGICVVYGPGGSGKSTLAVHYAADAGNRDGQQVTRFVPADSKEKLLEAFQEMASKLNIDHIDLARKWGRASRQYHEKLSCAIYDALKENDQRLLLMLDNAQNAELVRNCDLRRDKNRIKIIVTTRDPIAFSDYDSAQVELAGFSKAEEKAYVLQRLEPIKRRYPPDERVFEQAVEHLAAAVGPSPLRLELATGYIRTKSLHTAETYLEVLRAAAPKPGVIPEIAIGLARLNKLSQQAMRYSTELDVGFIPLSLLSAILGEEDRDKLEEILAPLEHLSLVRVISNEQGTDLGIRIHQDVQESCARYCGWVEEANITESDLLCRLVAVFHEKMPWVDSVPDDRWAAGELYAAHLAQVLSKAPSVLGDNPKLADLMSRMGAYQAEVNDDYQQGLTYYEQALTMRKALYGDQPHPDTAMSLNDVGVAYNTLGDVRTGLKYQEQALTMCQALYGDQPHPDVARSLDDVGEVYDTLGDIRRSLRYKEQALTMRKALYGDRPHPDIAESLNNVGAAYATFGDTKEELRCREQALEIRKALYGDQPHPDIAKSLNDVGAAYATLGDVKEGLRCREQALAMCQTLYGDQPHPEVANSLNSVGVAYHALGDGQESLTYFERSLMMYQTLYGDQPHPDVAEFLNNVGEVYNTFGDAQESLIYFARALKMYQALHGDQPHPEVAKSLNNVGVAHDALGDAQESLTYFEQALTMRKALYGDQPHPDVAKSLNSVGVAYSALGDAQESLTYFEQALEMKKTFYGDQPHPDIAGFLDDVGKAYNVLGDVQRGLTYFEQALRIREALYGDQPHPDIAESLNDVGEAYSALGDVPESLTYFQQALKMRKALYGDHPHPDIAKSLNDVGEAYNALGDAQGSLTRHEQALRMYRALYGNEPHSAVARSLNGLGAAYHSFGDAQASLRYSEQALKMNKTLYGDQPHPEVAMSLNSVGVAYNTLGDAQESLVFFERALTMHKALYGDQPHPEVAKSLNNVGVAYDALGDAQESLTCFEQVLTMRKTLYGDQPHPEVAISLNNVGVAYNALGEAKTGLKYKKQALSMYQALCGDQPCPQVAMSLNSVGVTYNALGEAKTGLKYKKQALSMYQILYGDQPHPDVVTALSSVGVAYNTLGDAREGLIYFEQALRMCRILYGDQPHPDIAESLHDVGEIYNALGEVQKSLMCFEQALTVFKAFYGDRPHPDVAMAFNSVGVAYHNLGDAQKGLRYKEQALTTYQALYRGRPHPEVAKSLNSVGLAYNALGDAKKGLAYFEQALKIRKTLHGDQPHPDVAMSLNSVGVAYNALGEAQTGLKYKKRALSMYQTFYKDQLHPDIAESLNSVGVAYNTLGDAQKSLMYFEQALTMRKTLYGDQPHPEVARSLNSVGAAYNTLGDAQKSLTYYEQALTIRKILYGDQSHPEVAMSLDNVGTAYWLLGEAEKTIRYYEEALKVLPEGHHLRRGLCHNLGCAHHLVALKADKEEDRKNCIDKATAFFEAAVAMSNAPDAGLSVEYANFLLHAGQLQQAYTYLTQAIASGDGASKLSYGLLDQATVAPPLQERIAQNKVAEVRAIDYTYYLLLCHYEAFEKAGIRPEATREAYLAAYAQGILARAGEPGEEKQDELAQCLLNLLNAS